MPAKTTVKPTTVKGRPAISKKVASKNKKTQPQKITYATLAMPPDDPRQDVFDRALENFRAGMGQSYPMIIGGERRTAGSQTPDVSPVNTDLTLGYFQKGTAQDARDAIAAARKAAPMWGRMDWKQRVKILRKAADTISKRNFEISAIMTLEVGKNRTEAMGDVEETADLIRYYCDQMEANQGYIREMGRESRKHHNTSILKPYGVWVVISPFNFPFALAGGPSGAALVAGNSVVFKPASDTPFVGYKLAECFLDAGVPEGVFNFVTGPGGTVGEELITNPDVDGITFTGSYEVGMRVYRTFPQGRCEFPRPYIIEMGGKNPAIVSRKADLDVAAMGIMRSAFGLQGQKCSACSRIFVEKPVAGDLLDRLVALTDQIAIGDPSRRDVWFGPVVNNAAADNYMRFSEELSQDGRIVRGGKRLTEGDLARGFFCAPTIVADLPLGHRLWKEEMFVPITTLAAVDDLDQAMRLANDVCYGLTAGFYSRDKKEIQQFFENIEAGVTYVNRAAGATTGAWPGFQPFGGWKGSGSTGKAGGGPYYVPQYMHEQSQTLIDL